MQSICLFIIFPKTFSIILFYLFFYDYKNLIYISGKIKAEKMFIDKYLNSFTAKILVLLTAFIKLIIIFYPKDKNF